MTKPDYCRTCPMHKTGTGFVPDAAPSDPLIAVMLRAPNKDDILFGEPLTGKGGRYWEREFLWPLDVRRDQVLLTNVLRCHTGERYPIAKVRTQAEKQCRHWDTALTAWNPNALIVTFNPALLFLNPAQELFIKRAFEKAVGLAHLGYRPLVVCGDEALNMYAPWLQGGLKRWQGHSMEIKSALKGA